MKLKSTNNEHVQEVQASNSRISQLSTELEASKTLLGESQETHSKLLSESENAKRSMLEEMLKQKKIHQASLKQLKAQHEVVIQKLEGRLRDANTTNEGLKQDYDANQGKLSSAHLTIDKCRAESLTSNANSQDKIEALKKQINALKHQNSNLSRKCQQEEKELDSLGKHAESVSFSGFKP
jgi:chromosome segregation ATPase